MEKRYKQIKVLARYKLGSIQREILDVEGTRAVKDFELSK
jgi:hypothetical protein